MLFTVRILLLFVIVQVGLRAQSFKSLNKKANDLFLIEDYKSALPIFLKLDSLSPANGELKYKIGYCYLQSSQKLKSLTYLKKADSLGFKALGMNFNLGVAYHASHQMAEAETQFLRALEMLTSQKAEQKKILETERYLRIVQTAKELMTHPTDVKVLNAGASINTPCAEYAPVISADESVLIFTSQRPCPAPSSKATLTNEDIYYSTQDSSGQWVPAQLIGREINSAGNDASIGLSADGQRLFVYKDVGKGDIYESELRGSKWTYPQRMPPPVNSPYWEPSISISSDRRTIYFVSARPGGKGGRDLYTSTFDAHTGVWSEPKNLEPLNTAYHEDAPFIHPDGKTLYFSSEGHHTMGGFDIFKSVYKPDSLQWAAPVNIGYPINTASDDIFFVWTANGEKGYFSSDREGGFGLDDIYTVTRKSELPSLIMLKGKILEDSSKQPLEAEISVINNVTRAGEGTYLSNSSTGRFLVMLVPGHNYGISVVRKGYLPYSENINVNDSGYYEIGKTIYLGLVKIGNGTVLNNVFFDSGKSILKPESFATLDLIVTFLKNNKNVKSEIAGHTDDVGNDRENKILSQQRAEAVKNYLVAHGIAPDRITAKGYGEDKPVADNATVSGKSHNRRTELIVK